jgi:replicative superfamily II helicase
VFVQSRRRAEAIAQLLKDAGYRTEHHHGGLTTSLRRQVEQRLRSGETTVLIATATLEAGLNLALRRVILYDLQIFNGRNYEPLPVNSVWQRAGRAGGPSLGDQGEAVLFTPTWERATERYTQGDFQPILSALASR